ncbi:MAG: FHA domain-containing protein, partial [Gammaproteobacteria bacterium]|nr:FHA domain-containing protein [Gammaproteobacteria bacterium]
REFACQTGARSPDVALIELEEFVVRQARDGRVSLLVVRNVNEMYPSALRLLCKLAELKSQGRFALRMVLVSRNPSFNIIHAPAMTAIAVRTFSAFELGPMTGTESQRYLYAKLRASGCASPDNVFPADICSELYTASRGWPGILDSLAMQAIERARNWPIALADIYPPVAAPMPAATADISLVRDDAEPEVQKLYLTLNRQTLQEFEIRDSKILIGRSAICDISISSRFVSKHHALLIRGEDSMHLVDLNSTNGTFVNSVRVQSTALRHDDIISLGNHGIKLIAPAYRAKPINDEPDLSATTTMKTLEDLRDIGDDTDSETVAAENS